MDGFSYVGLFDTKGIEYIIIIVFLILIIPFWRLLNRPLRPSLRSAGDILPLSVTLYSIPQGLYFGNNHTWAHLSRTGEARLGMDSILTGFAGEAEFRMMKEPGSRIRKGDEIAELVSEGRRLRVSSPVSGTLTRVNQLLRTTPLLLRDDPYDEGWICCMKPSDWISEVSHFHIAGDATEWLKGELQRMKDFLAVAAGRLGPGSHAVYMQDGGEPENGLLASLPAEVWDEFGEKFLK
jgi:glycine cleavage system H protein